MGSGCKMDKLKRNDPPPKGPGRRAEIEGDSQA